MPDLGEKWSEVAATLRSADSIAFDGCHKIYVLMDEGQTQQMKGYGYGSDDDGSKLITRKELGDGAQNERMLEMLHEWWDESCGLRFINAVKSPGENGDFETLIGQFEDEDDDDWDEEND